ncbi:MAG: aspartoacylase, partial [Deltaproteobacteria bacterium]|nr:aspartoacylase [Deltaproteobacteria bacterium]
RSRLARASQGAPELVEITHRHVCRDGDGFTMLPGFQSFQHIERGALLATDASGEIRATDDRILLMPRYQPQGEDGFFLARRVHPAWLGVSAVLRRTPLPRWLTRLPGVTARGGGAVDVDPRVARVLVRELMHLAGYRLKHSDATRLTFTTRIEREG